MQIIFSVIRRWYGVSIVLACHILLLFNASLHAAAVFDPSTQPPRTLAPFVFKNTNLQLGATKIYRPWFENKAWTGDLIEYNIAADGSFSLLDINWRAQAVFADKEKAASNYWNSGRKIITSTNGTNQKPFRWGDISSAQQISLIQSDVLDFVRGNRDREGYGMRTRFSILGDIIGSTPRYVAVPNAGYPFSGYSAFAYSKKDRSARIYVGANDGMVHAFDAGTGSEVFAYIPSMVIPNLFKLTQIPYTHTYFVDGDLGVGDAYFGPVDSVSWKTILAGGLGAGGKGLFALDITNPNLDAENSMAPSDQKILFEKTHADLGHVYGSPSVVKLPDGKWYVISGNGYGSTNGKAKLFLIELNSPTYTETAIDPDTTDLTLNNGLSTPVFLDKDNDSVADFAYAGDLKGRLWKFEFDKDASNDLVVTATKLFDAGVNQPITVAPDIAVHPKGGYLIYFGTGSLLSNDDIDNTQQQSVYAIWDKISPVGNVCHDGSTGDLLCQSLTEGTTSGTTIRYLATSYSPDWSVHKGWKVDLLLAPQTSERLLGHPQLRGGRLQFVTTIPSATGAESWLMELDYLSGGDSGSILFDLNDDSVLNSSDVITVGSDTKKAVAKKLDAGNLSQPAIARIDNGTDSKIINGLLLSFDTPCTGSCPGGLVGGHLDVDIDTAKEGLGGGVATNSHEYDDVFGLTYVDYFDLQGINNYNVTDDEYIVVEGKIEEDTQKLVALIANADLSPGAVLIIGDRSWNVVEYQKLIQKQLAAWSNGSESDLVDDDGKPLAFTLDEINSAKGGSGTLRIAFDDQAILIGGLIPNTSCVELDPLVLLASNGRWRSGALTLQLLDYDRIKQDIDNFVEADERVYLLQNVTDLPNSVSLPTGIELLQESGVSYGGVIANPHLEESNTAFLYESALYWHLSGDKCYGTDEWENYRILTLLTIFKINDFFATLSTEFLTNIFPPEGSESDPDDYLSQLVEALVPIFPIFQSYIYDIAHLADYIIKKDTAKLIHETSSIGVAVTKDLSNQQSSPGPSYTEGRQSWLEIELGAL